MSIYENVAYGLRAQGIKDKKHLDEVVERSLRGAALWDEVKIVLNLMPLVYQVASSSVFVSRAPSPWNPM